MQIEVISASSKQPDWVRSGFDTYARRLRGSCKMSLTEIPLAKRSGSTPPSRLREQEGGRILAWIGDTISKDEIEIGMPLQVVPRIFEEVEEIKVYYSLEKPGTTWGVVPPS